MLDSYQSNLPFRHYQHLCDVVIFTPFLQCKNADSLWQILQKLVHPMTKVFFAEYVVVTRGIIYNLPYKSYSLNKPMTIFLSATQLYCILKTVSKSQIQYISLAGIIFNHKLIQHTVLFLQTYFTPYIHPAI